MKLTIKDGTKDQFMRNVTVIDIDGTEYEVEERVSAEALQSLVDRHVLKMQHTASLRDGVL